MKREGLILTGIGLFTLLLVVGAALLLSSPVSSPDVKSQGQTVTDKGLLLGPEEQRNSLGTASAKVTIVEYGDFQCPACGAVDPTVKKIVQEYKNKVYYVFRNFPLPMHANAQLAAQAAYAAGQQNKFWEMHTKLYEKQSEWGEKSGGQTKELIVGYAKELGLDISRFTVSVDGNAGSDKIQKDQNDGYKSGVDSTPTFFINGVKFSAVLSYDQFKKEIDSRLK